MKRPLSVALIALGAGLIALGLLTGQNAQLLQKATQICLECIGVG